VSDSEAVYRVWMRAHNRCPTCEKRPPGRQPSECPECWGIGTLPDRDHADAAKVWESYPDEEKALLQEALAKRGVTEEQALVKQGIGL
jgi:hypothetical protein